MMTSSNGNISAPLALCAGNSSVTGELPSQRPVTRSFDVFFDLYLKRRLSNQSRRWWFETPSRPLWRYCNDRLIIPVVLLPIHLDILHEMNGAPGKHEQWINEILKISQAHNFIMMTATCAETSNTVMCSLQQEICPYIDIFPSGMSQSSLSRRCTLESWWRHPTLHWAYDCLSMPGLKLIHVSERSPSNH